MRLAMCVLVAAVACSATPHPNVPPARSSVVDRIDAALVSYQDYGQLSGVVLVADGGEVVYRKAFGLANQEWRIANTVDTRFRIGSITKSFTATLVFQLIEKGVLKRDGKVTDYLPDFPHAKGDKITIDHLLAHSAGLRDLSDFPRRGKDFPAIVAKINAGFVDTSDLVKAIAGYDLLFEPGTDVRYSNDGFILLGAIIEKVTGKPYAKVLDEMILAPLGMKGSGLAYRAPVVHGRASGYDRTFYGDENAPPILVSANGGMYSTVDDLLRFSEAMATNRLVSQASRDVLFRVSPNVIDYGWKVLAPEGNAGGDNTIVTDGLVPGFTSLMARRGGRVIVILTNHRLISHKIVEISTCLNNLLDRKQCAPPRRSLAEAMFAAVHERGRDAARSLFETGRKDPTYALDEGELNAAGYTLLGDGSVAHAIVLFELGAAAFPSSFNAYDSLAEAYMIHGDKQLAIQNYKRSLELNPNNTNAAVMLKKLGAPP
jgi:CubicO group peptidase (beta-lactamase class C family)